MLVVHPSSSCEICFDHYTLQTLDSSPYCIPCGHIFCGRCFKNLISHVCPFCRDPFNSRRIRKLHVEKGPVPDKDEKKELALLRRIATYWSGTLNEASFGVLRKDVERWVSKQEDAANDPVFAAWKAIILDCKPKPTLARPQPVVTAPPRSRVKQTTRKSPRPADIVRIGGARVTEMEGRMSVNNLSRRLQKMRIPDVADVSHRRYPKISQPFI